MGKFTLGYWDIRGLAGSIRLVLAHAGAEWDDKLYVTGPAPTFDKSSWFTEKPKLGLDFPNNPYLIDEESGLRLSQSHAILRYLGRKFNLIPQTEAEWIRVDLAECEEMDLRSSFVNLCYCGFFAGKDFEKERAEWLKNLPTKLEQWNKFMKPAQWVAGSGQLTYVDFLLYDLLDQIMFLEPKALDGFENLKDFMNRFNGLEKVAKYMKSDRYIKYPLNNRMASFGN